MSKVKVKILGSGNAFNQDNRLNASYLIESAGNKILIDCGFTTPFALQQNNISFNEIDVVLITHYHGDHFAGLSAMLLALYYKSPQNKKLTIIGGGDVKKKVFDLIKTLYSGSEKIFKLLDIEFQTVSKTFFIGETLVESIPMVHSTASLPFGFILNFDSCVIGFSGDTSWHKGVEDLIIRTDYLFLECNLTKKLGKGHISVEELEDSELIQVKKNRVFLTHLSRSSYSVASKKGYVCISDGDDFSF